MGSAMARSTAWQQAADDLTAAIGSGEFKPGDKMPAMVAMGERIGVSAATIVTAYDRLTADGILSHEPGGSYFVRDQHGEPSGDVPSPALLTVAECAYESRLSKMTIYRMVRDGTIRSKRIGRTYRIYADSWRAYLNDGRE